jgi:Zn-dependent peptidase ImmA (M78 family)/transcriptional regulator with XRE-family HTH domain
MPTQTVTISVRSAVLKWARETSGWTIDDLARKLHVTVSTLERWETVDHELPLSTVTKIAEYCKRPLSAFFLPTPPKEPPLPSDFRMLPEHESQFSKLTLLAIRRARRLQRVAHDLIQELELPSQTVIGSARLSDDPEILARTERARLAIGIDQQRRWPSYSKALSTWRTAIESTNTLVFQFAMPVKDARGFSLGKTRPFIIVLSSKDATRARVFTLFHEYGHLLLKRPGVCIPEGDPASTIGGNVEQWCNRFAGSFLLPTDILQTDREIRAFGRSTRTQPGLLDTLANRYKVSAQVILIRLLTSGYIVQSRYEAELAYIEEQRARQKEVKDKSKEFKLPAARICLREKGRLFPSLILDGSAKNLVTYGEVADYLSLQLKYLGKLQTLLEA